MRTAGARGERCFTAFEVRDGRVDDTADDDTSDLSATHPVEHPSSYDPSVIHHTHRLSAFGKSPAPKL
jgi:hypothetical protein